MKAQRFWASWVQPTDDHRPKTYPPNAAILGWWCSGYDADDNATLVALIEAADEDAALRAVTADWPEIAGWRFIETCGPEFRLSDRFPLSDWMKQRI